MNDQTLAELMSEQQFNAFLLPILAGFTERWGPIEPATLNAITDLAMQQRSGPTQPGMEEVLEGVERYPEADFDAAWAFFSGRLPV